MLKDSSVMLGCLHMRQKFIRCSIKERLFRQISLHLHYVYSQQSQLQFLSSFATYITNKHIKLQIIFRQHIKLQHILQINIQSCNKAMITSLNNSLTVSDNAINKQLFLPQQLETIRLGQLRNKRRQLQDKLKLVSNRINFRKKKEEEELKRYIRSQEKSRIISQSRNHKLFQEMLKEELDERKEFQSRKKAKEVEEFRVSHNRRLHLIQQAVRDRRVVESQKVRRLKRMDEQMRNTSKQNTELQLREKHQQIVRMKERQQAKKKYYWMVEKRLTFQQNMMEEAQVYEKQIQDFHRKIEMLRKNQEQLRSREEHAAEVLKCAEQNYQLLKKT